MIAPIFYLSVALFMAILLTQAGVHKLAARRKFLASLRGHGVVPKIFEKPLTYLLATIEILLALAWIAFPQTFWVGIATAALLLGYGAVLTFSFITGRTDAGCGCEWGDVNLPIQWWMPFRNLVIALAALSTLTPSQITSISTFEYLNAFAFSICAAIIYFAINELTSVIMRSKSLTEVSHG